VRDSMLTALTNVRATHLLDRGLWESLGLEVAQELPDPPAAESESSMGDRRPLRVLS